MPRASKTWTSKDSSVRVTKTDRKRYALKRKRDSRILLMCKALMKQRLKKEDRRVVILIKSQLVDDWRRPLMVELNRLLKKYQHAKSVQNLDI